MSDENGSRASSRPALRDPEETTRTMAIDHEARAKEREAEIRAQLGNAAADIYKDKFYAEAPPGWRFNWKLFSALGKEYPQYLASLMRSGWRPVPASRVRHLLYPEYDQENTIVDGQILMEIPESIARQRDDLALKSAKDQVRSKEESAKYEAPEGTAPRPKQFEGWRPSIKTEIGPMGVPD